MGHSATEGGAPHLLSLPLGPQPCRQPLLIPALASVHLQAPTPVGGGSRGGSTPQVSTHHSLDSWAPGAGPGSLGGLESWPQKQARALAAPVVQVQGLEGAESYGGGFSTPC